MWTIAAQNLFDCHERRIGIEILARLVDGQGSPLSPTMERVVAGLGWHAVDIAVIDNILRRPSVRQEPGYLFLNVSAETLLSGAVWGWLDAVGRLANARGRFHPTVVEFSERLLAAPALIQAMMHRVKSRGALVALDDFADCHFDRARATLPWDIIKIDWRSLGGERGRLLPLRHIIHRCRQRNIPVVVEGVETHGDLAEVFAAGAWAVQGFVLSRPALILENESASQRAAE